MNFPDAVSAFSSLHSISCHTHTVAHSHLRTQAQLGSHFLVMHDSRATHSAHSLATLHVTLIQFRFYLLKQYST